MPLGEGERTSWHRIAGARGCPQVGYPVQDKRSTILRQLHGIGYAHDGGRRPSQHDFKELQVPLKPIAAKRPTLGLGLTSANDVSAAASLASSPQTNKLCECFLPGSITDLATSHDAKAAFSLWNSS